MQFKRCRNPQSLRHIEDRVIDSGEFIDKKTMIEILAMRLKDEELSKQTFVIVMIDDSTLAKKIVGHIVAMSNPLTPFVFVYEAEYEQKLPAQSRFDLVLKSKQLVIDWARLQGKTSIRMQTSRNPEAWQRAWNLKPVATIMEFNLIEDDEFEDLQPREMEQPHGRRINSGIESSGRPEGTDRGNHQTDSGGANSVGESEQPVDDRSTDVPRAAAGEVASGDGRLGSTEQQTQSDSGVSDFHERSIAELERQAGI